MSTPVEYNKYGQGRNMLTYLTHMEGIVTMAAWNWTSKELRMITHYQKILMKQDFDEYDILGFLIFIRSYCKHSGLDLIYEFGDLIAHRERNKGRIMSCIEAAIKNCYDVQKKNSNCLVGYRGIKWDEWKSQWKVIGEEIGAEISDQLLQEIMLCIFSLAQDTKYKCSRKDGKNEYCGYIRLFQDSMGKISLCTTEGKPGSCYVCFMIAEGVEGLNRELDGVIVEPVESFRLEGMLHVKIGSEKLLI